MPDFDQISEQLFRVEEALRAAGMKELDPLELKNLYKRLTAQAPAQGIISMTQGQDGSYAVPQGVNNGF